MKETPLEQDPSVYLPSVEVETPEERALTKQIGTVEPRHVAAVAVRVHQQADWQARRDGWERFFKRAGAALAGLALANIGVVIKSWLMTHDAAIEAAAESRAAKAAEIEYRKGVKEQLDRIDRDIRDIQRALRRIGAAPPLGDISVGQIGGPSWSDSSF